MQDKHTEPHWDSSALIVIDMQVGFVSPKVEQEGSRESRLAANIALILDAYRSTGRAIVHVIRSYLPDASDTDIYRKGIVERGEFSLEPGTERADIINMLKPRGAPAIDFDLIRNGGFHSLGPSEWVMYKPRLGVFYKTPLEGWLRERNIDTVVFTGTFYPNCVRTSIYEANKRDFRAVAVKDAIVGFYDKAVKELSGVGVASMNTGDVVGIINPS